MCFIALPFVFMCFAWQQNLYITPYDTVLLIITICYTIVRPAKVEVITTKN